MLSGFYHPSHFKAGGAHFNSAHLPVDHCPHASYVGLELPAGTFIRVTYPVPENHRFSTDFTSERHVDSSASRAHDIKSIFFCQGGTR